MDQEKGGYIINSQDLIVPAMNLVGTAKECIVFQLLYLEVSLLTNIQKFASTNN